MKATTKILFIDDNHTEYKIVSILKKAGWTKTKSVKDITDLDSNLITESDIIFVDINGVGLELFEDQGLGLASALKKKYPQKKIVIYSAETTGDRFHDALRQVDHCLPKNADAYQFINLIENLMKN
jgi:DNA-binding NtrC family response regulator